MIVYGCFHGNAVKMPALQHELRKMEIDEFVKKQQPRAKRLSRLDPHLAGILELKNQGYANWQICEWLAENGVKVSQEGLRKFLKNRANKNCIAQYNASKPAPTTGENKSEPTSNKTEKTEGKPVKKITNPQQVRAARKREINLDDYTKE